MYFVTSCLFVFVVFFDQLLGAAHTWKLVETLLSAVSKLFVHFKPFSVYFDQLLGAHSTRKLVIRTRISLHSRYLNRSLVFHQYCASLRPRFSIAHQRSLGLSTGWHTPMFCNNLMNWNWNGNFFVVWGFFWKPSREFELSSWVQDIYA